MKKIQSSAAAIVTVYALFVIIETGYGQVVPYKASGNDASYSTPLSGGDGRYTGSGNGTHVGKHTFDGIAVPTGPTENPGEFFWEVVGVQVVTAPDGSEIFLSGQGTVQLIPLDEVGIWFGAVWVGEFVVEGGSGRFEDVQGTAEPLSVVAINDPFNIVEDPEWFFSWEIQGKIDLGRRQAAP